MVNKLFQIVLSGFLLFSVTGLVAQSQLSFDAYHSGKEVQQILNKLQQSNSAATKIHTIATSPGGEPVTVLEIGSRIQVFSYTGAAVRDFKVRSNVETVSLTDQPAGMYLIRISDANSNNVGRYKLIKR